jgi:hypothetical protein
MKLIATVFAALITLFTICGISQAAPLRTHVAEFSVSGVQGRDDLKTTLQGVLASRLNPELVQLVESADKAELTVSGSYARFGRAFSLDVQLKNRASESLLRVFEQGEGEDDLLPAIGRLVKKIDGKIAGSTSTKPVAPSVAAVAPKALAVSPKDVYQLRSDEGEKAGPGGWTSSPLGGVFSGIAPGRTFGSGERELFVAGERSIRYYLKGAELKMVAEAAVPNPAKILAIDTADLDRDGIPEIYVTVYDRETLVSRVYLPKNNALELVAENLPWFFRGIGIDFKSRTLYGQEMNSGGILSSSVSELAKNGQKYSAKNSVKLPASGYVFNFNRLGGSAGKGDFVVLNADGYLAVSRPGGEEVWKSSIKYGGSEGHYKVESADQRRSLGDSFQWTFLEQRIAITPEGTLLVPHNQGLFNVGNSRSYTRYSLHALHWNGSSLQEKWHTRQNQSYLADFAYDAAARELILLEVVQKADMFSKGNTVISINRVE